MNPYRTSCLTSDNAFVMAMRRLAATVCIVASRDKNRNFGMVATAISSLSVDPPSILVCINRGASIHPVICKNGTFSVNILREEQRSICDDFSGKHPQETRFSNSEWCAWEELSAPYLAGAQATIFCNVETRIEHATHSIFVGHVKRTIVQADVAPLVYADGKYAKLAALP